MPTPVRPTAERVRELLAYDAETGVLTWRRQRGGRRVGDVAGYVAPNGYIYVSVDDRMELAHLLIWLIQTGEWPDRKIDHRDRVRLNNRWLNLRTASNAENSMNCSIRSDNTSGARGVCKRRSRWEAYISIGGRRISLGRYGSPSEAASARQTAERKFYGDFATC